MQTIVHTYCFDIRDAEGAKQYEDLKRKLSEMGLDMFESHGGKKHYQPNLDNLTVTLQTEHLFNNQWNTAPVPGVSDIGLRLFDWAQDYEPYGNPRLKQGHWLEQTPEMADIRRNTYKCGYCGAQEPAAKGYVFCPHCLDSSYLKSSDLHLTRMLPVSESGVGANRAPLSEAEKGHLLPLYKEAQIRGSTERGRARIAKARADIEKTYKKTIANAQAEHDGKLWLMDHGIGLDNVIYYDHTGRFGFGWRDRGLDPELVSQLLEVISEFPFPYDIICADGRKLSGD